MKKVFVLDTKVLLHNADAISSFSDNLVVSGAQNLTLHEVKTIISRAGEGTKIVLTGDPYQTDTPYLDSRGNGQAYTVERLKDHQIHGMWP